MDIEILSDKDINDFSNLIKIFEKVFEWDNFSLPTTTHLQRLLKNESFLVFVAKTNHQLVGGLTVHVLDRYDTEKPSAYIYDIAVLPNYQRKGIGKLLIETLKDYCERNGFSEAFVQAETDDHQAVSFYRTTPNTNELLATHFTYSFDKMKGI